MTPEQIDLARRLVARPEWRHSVPGGQLRDERGIQWVYSDEADWNAGGSGQQVPNLTDDATGGVLLGMLPGTWGVRKGERGHQVEYWRGGQPMITSPCPTLAEAAARALLACWEAADANR